MDTSAPTGVSKGVYHARRNIRQHQHNAAHERRHGNQPAVITAHKKSGYMRYDKTDKCDASTSDTLAPASSNTTSIPKSLTVRTFTPKLAALSSPKCQR